MHCVADDCNEYIPSILYAHTEIGNIMSHKRIDIVKKASEVERKTKDGV